MKKHLPLTLIILLSAILRIYGITDESLWLDEGALTDRIGWDYFDLFSDRTQGPLFLFIMKAWCQVFGMSELSLRLPAAIFGIVGVWMIYRLGRELFSRRAGLFSALFLAVNPFAIHYSQDARPYTLLLLPAAASFFFTIRLLRANRLSNIAGYIISTLAALYTHPFGVFILPVHVSALLIFRRSFKSLPAYQFIRSLLIPLAVTVFLYLPQMYLFGSKFLQKAGGGNIARWITMPSFFGMLATGGQYFMNPFTSIAVAAFLLITVPVIVRKDRRSWAGFFFAISIAACCILIPWLISRLGIPIYVHRYTIPALTAVILILGWTVASLKASFRTIVTVSLVLLFIFPLYHYYTKIDKDPWRQTVEILRSRLQTGDRVVVHRSFNRSVFEYYFDHPKNIPVLYPNNAADLQKHLESRGRIWLVRAYQEKVGVTKELLSALKRGRETPFYIKMNDLIERNPHAYFTADIELTLYSPRKSDAVKSTQEKTGTGRTGDL